MPINHFPFVGTHFKTGWDSKGMAVPLALGNPIGAGSALLAVVSKGGSAALAGRIQRNRRFRGTRLCAQSLVCYTFGDRGWLKGVVRGRNKHFQPATEQADFGAPRTEIQDLPRGKIRLFGCRWCGERSRRSEAEPWNGAASPGEPMGYHPPSRRDTSFVLSL